MEQGEANNIIKSDVRPQYNSKNNKLQIINFTQKNKLSQRMDKHQSSTVSSEDEKAYFSVLRLINSENLTAEMAVNYLFEWRSNPKLIQHLLPRIAELCFSKAVHYVPTIVFIMSLQNNNLFEKFCEKMANASLSRYLLLRWSYSTYMITNKSVTENMRNKLDSSLIKKTREEDFQQHDMKKIEKQMKEKVDLSNYVLYTNEFFERLFAIPEKLKKYEKSKRNQKLRERLVSAFHKFHNNKNDYLDSIPFPIQNTSNACVGIQFENCFTFSTKERVPFKLVMETISTEDALRLKNGEKLEYVSEKDEMENEKESFVLPQSYFGKEWKYIRKGIKAKSKFGKLKSHKVQCFMVKSGDDLRQEYMAMQLIKLIKEIADKQNLKIWVKPYSVIPFDSDSGLIEFVDDTRTVSYLKEVSGESSLRNIYKQIFGLNWQASISNFIQSLAGYSVIQYLFKIKDRHNNNILVDTMGHIIHIDYSFIISSSPGNMNFEKAPFKLTKDYLDIMEGPNSDIFKHFKMLFFFALKYLRKYKKEIMQTILMMTHCKGMKCFENFQQGEIEKRFHENATDEELEEIVEGIIKQAVNSYSTSHYDTYQWYTNYIYT